MSMVHTQAYAATFTAFGPKIFVRGSSKPVIETASFNIKAPNTTYTLKIFNGDITSEYAKVSSALITLNGTTVFGPSDFNQQGSSLQKQVNVSKSNQIQVELRSEPGSAITMILEGEDNTLPSITINSPSNGSYTNSPSATITGTATDSISWIEKVAVEGRSATFTGETYISNIQLTEGQNTITATGTDAAGNAENASVSVVLDTIPPKITIDPVPSLTNKPQITITGKIEDASPIVALTINGKAIGTIGQSPFQLSTELSLSEGLNNIEIIATDKAGNISSTSVTITLDTIAPVVTITSPANGSTVKTSKITVTGTIDDNTATVTVNGIKANVLNNSFTAEGISLSEGTNTIIFIASDMAGNKYERNISLIYSEDKVPPVINATLPLGYLGITTSQTIKVSGSIDDNTATVTVNNITASVSNNNFSAEITLNEGWNNISITATDPYGNTSRIYRTAYFDLKAPVVTINSPANESYIKTYPYQKINADISDLSFRYFTSMYCENFKILYNLYNHKPVLINGQELPASQYYITGCTPKKFGPSWQGDMNIELSIGFGWQLGANVITLNALDFSGRTSSASVTAYFDPYPPSVTDISPVNGSIVFLDKIDITGAISENDKIAGVKVNDTDAIISGNTFQVTDIDLTEGLNTINITATDAAGNIGTTSVRITYIKPDSISPAITITSPSDGQAVNLSFITVTGTIDDNYATVSVNGIYATVKNSSYIASGISLSKGANTIEIIAVDLFGNSTTASITVHLDIIPPLAVITSPKNGSIVNTGTITVRGYINDNTVTVTVNGVTAPVTNSAFTASIPLTEGANTVTVIATDPAGNTTNSTLTVYRDTTPPQAAATNPKENETNVSINTPITATFSEPLDPTTVSTSTFLLASETGTVSSSVTYNEAASTTIFTPDYELVPDMTYTAIIKSGIKDKAGNASTTDYIWSFKTGTPIINISITGPANNTAINKAKAMIKGTIQAKTADVGITVNGVIAEVNGTIWAAIVPLSIGTNLVTATATDGQGNKDIATVTITTESTQQPVATTTNPQSGIAPLNTTFGIDTSISNPITSHRIDFEGDGVTDLETTDVSNITHSYDIPRIYYPTFTVTDSQGNTYTEITTINVLDRTQMDVLLKSKWDGMKGAMGSVDPVKALSYFDESIKQKFSRVFSDLGSDLPSIVASLEDITLVSFTGEIAEYAIGRNQDGQRNVYFIYFMKDKDGIWKIKGM